HERKPVDFCRLGPEAGTFSKDRLSSGLRAKILGENRMKRFMIGSLVATIVMYVWGAVFWMSPQPYQVLQRTANDAAIGKLLRDNFPESGTYLVPGQYNDKQTLPALFKAGPIATIHLQREGAEMMSPMVLVSGFIHQLI